MQRVALTGGIASGKSSVAARFAAQQVPVASADRFSREVVAKGSDGLRDVIDAFGNALLTSEGTLDRRALREVIFNDNAARKRLESLLHPRIRRATDRWCERQANEGAAFCVIEIPLLVETQQQAKYDRVLLVDVPVEQQIARVCSRDNCSESEARRIIDNQASRQDRLAVATDVLLNDRALDSLHADADSLVERLIGLYESDPVD